MNDPNLHCTCDKRCGCDCVALQERVELLQRKLEKARELFVSLAKKSDDPVATKYNVIGFLDAMERLK